MTELQTRPMLISFTSQRIFSRIRSLSTPFQINQLNIKRFQTSALRSALNFEVARNNQKSIIMK